MVAWFENKQEFYGLNTDVGDNVEETEFESGKKRYMLKNSTAKKIHSFSFLLRSKEKEVEFWNWYDNVLLSRTETVKLYDLVTKTVEKEYRMTERPRVAGSQFPKECTITVQEE